MAKAKKGKRGERGGGWPRSIWAVVAGVLVNFIAAPVDAVLHATGVYPPVDAPPMSDGLFGVAFAYRIALAVAGGWATARLAPANRMKHVWVLAGIGLVLSTAGALAMGHLGPRWYAWGLVAICIPCSLAGAKLAR